MAAADAAETSGDGPWSVADLAAAIKGVLSRGLPSKVRVVGEISNLSDRNHWFFSLKDDAASFRAVMFASSARRVGFPVRDGQEVVATGRVDFYDAQGSVQLYVDKLEPVGEGARELALRAMMEELRELGYFAIERKKRLPAVPRRIAVVTSRSAAALQDVIDTATRRWAGCELVLVDVRVQGDAAAGQIAGALKKLSREGTAMGIEAILLTRGGGSIEDLWAFNERVVADAIYACSLPVVAAIGHETDTTVAELVADVRCATPTQAAMTLIPDRAVLAEQIDQGQRRLELALARLAEHCRTRVEAAARFTLFRQPERLVARAEDRLDGIADRLHAGPGRRLKTSQRRLDALARTLDAVSPTRVLQRGYSITRSADGRLLRSVNQAKPGERLLTELSDGEVQSVVGTKPGEPNSRTRSKRKKTPKAKGPPDGPTLFE